MFTIYKILFRNLKYMFNFNFKSFIKSYSDSLYLTKFEKLKTTHHSEVLCDGNLIPPASKVRRVFCILLGQGRKYFRIILALKICWMWSDKIT